MNDWIAPIIEELERMKRKKETVQQPHLVVDITREEHDENEVADVTDFEVDYTL